MDTADECVCIRNYIGTGRIHFVGSIEIFLTFESSDYCVDLIDQSGTGMHLVKNEFVEFVEWLKLQYHRRNKNIVSGIGLPDKFDYIRWNRRKNIYSIRANFSKIHLNKGDVDDIIKFFDEMQTKPSEQN